jgi:alkylation response protein AidB-like acyl-CoA dehydrogenase
VTGDPRLELSGFRASLRSWLGANAGALPGAGHYEDFAAQLMALRELQRVLYDEGWARYGWPEALGGLGGDARHRAVLYDELAERGFSTRSVFEHLEILAPAMAQHWQPTLMRSALSELLRGDTVWSSEPDAGSDLAALRTRARRDGGGYRINGRKIWTSWASYADRCVVLARTGTTEERHRGLSALFVDLSEPGVDVRAIRQANGVEELAEVTFDDVWVAAEHCIGAEGAGWQFALDVLACERSAFAWLRQARLYCRADALAGAATRDSAATIGDLSLDLLALRATSAEAVRVLASGRFVGPDAAPSKVLLTTAEQHLYDAALGVLGTDLVLGGDLEWAEDWQEEYLFSRAVSIYGGTRQIQYSTIARFGLGLPR